MVLPVVVIFPLICQVYSSLGISSGSVILAVQVSVSSLKAFDGVMASEVMVGAVLEMVIDVSDAVLFPKPSEA